MGDPMNGAPVCIPVFLFHAVTDTPGDQIAPFAVSPAEFERQLDTLTTSGYRFITYGELVKHVLTTAHPAAGGAAVSGPEHERLAVITFDDGYRDFAAHALPALLARAMPSTVFVTTGWLDGSTKREPGPTDPMLHWSQLPELRSAGVEIGAHSHSHPQLDTLSTPRLRDELLRSKELLEDAMTERVASLANPHGYNGPRVRAMARRLGYESAAGVRNTRHRLDGDVFNIARLTVMRGTDPAQLSAWLCARDHPVRRRESLATKGWRMYRRGRAVVQRRPGSVYR